jgi:hypothetical protein
MIEVYEQSFPKALECNNSNPLEKEVVKLTCVQGNNEDVHICRLPLKPFSKGRHLP